MNAKLPPAVTKVPIVSAIVPLTATSVVPLMLRSNRLPPLAPAVDQSSLGPVDEALIFTFAAVIETLPSASMPTMPALPTVI